MTPAALSTVARRLAGPSDQELLGRYAATRDGEAFAAVVRRHGPAVRAACRQVLADPAAADDAFQAAFLVLLRRADSVAWADSVGGWLYATAHRLAVRARADAARRQARERIAGRAERVDAPDPSWREAVAVLHEELDRLPDRHRLPLLLCYLDGRSRDEAAALLGWTPGAVKGRLERGRRALADRLTRRGITLSAGLLGTLAAGPGGVSAELVNQTLTAVGGGASPAVVALVRGALPMTGVKLGLFGLTAAGLVAGAVWAATPGPAVPLADPPPVTPKTVAVAPPPRPAEPKTVRVTGHVLGPDGKPVAGAKLLVNYYGETAAAPQPAADANGRFAFDLPHRRWLNLVALATGLGADWVMIYDVPTTDLTLRLPEDQPIVGRVVDPAGKPLAGVGLRVMHAIRPAAGQTLDRWLKAKGKLDEKDGPAWAYLRGGEGHLAGRDGLPTATTDRDGRFTLRGIGRDRVVALRLLAPAVMIEESSVVTRTTEPFSGWSMWRVGEVLYQGAEPVLVAKPAAVTTGRVTDAVTGRPVAGLTVRVDGLSSRIDATSSMSIAGEETVTDADGRYTLPGLPGQADGSIPQVHVVPPAGEPYHRLARFVPDEAEARAKFDFALVRGVWATVKVVDKRTGRPVEAQLRYGVFPADNPAAAAVPDYGHDIFVPLPGTRLYGRRAEYRAVVFPGRGMLAAGLNEERYLTGVGVEAFEAHRENDQLVGLAGVSNIHWGQWGTFQEIDVPADAKEFAVTIALDPGVSADARLLDEVGKPVPGAVASGLANTPHGSGYWTAEPVAGADFTAVALRPGEVRRLLFLQLDRKLAGTVLAVGGAVDPVEVRMVPWGAVTGRLVDAAGMPVGAAKILGIGRSGDDDPTIGTTPFGDFATSAGKRVHSGADGRFVVPGLVPGLTYQFTARGAGGGGDLPEVVTKSGETVDVGDVALPAAKK